MGVTEPSGINGIHKSDGKDHDSGRAEIVEMSVEITFHERGQSSGKLHPGDASGI
jgi:hypothetical protein